MAILKKPSNQSENPPLESTGSVNVALDSKKGPSAGKSTKGRLLPIAVVLVVIAAAIGLYVFYQDRYGDDKTASSVNFSQDSVSGSGKGRSIAFKKPDNLVPSGDENTAKLKGFIKLAPSPKDSNSLVDVSRMLVSAKDLPADLVVESYIAQVEEAVKNPNSKDYKAGLTSVQNFAKSGFPEPTISIKVGQAVAFSNSNVKSNAWQFDIAAQDSSGLTPTHNGKVIWIVGQKTYYQILLSATASDWKNNSRTWNQVIDSIKIDQ